MVKTKRKERRWNGRRRECRGKKDWIDMRKSLVDTKRRHKNNRNKQTMRKIIIE